MANENCVVFKGKKDGILVMLDNSVDFEYLKESLKKKVVEANKFFSGAKTSITFRGRTLSEDEESQLLEIIFRETNLHITFVHVEPVDNIGNNSLLKLTRGNRNNSESDEKAEINSLNSTLNATLNTGQEGITFFHHGALRSGQSIRYAGSVVVLGDVNPGGEIIAEGNIIVLGILKGLVHAGCAGNKESFVSALRLAPTQLRIADTITYIPLEKPEQKDTKTKRKQRMGSRKVESTHNVPPSYAYIHDGQIYIAPLINL